MNNDLSPAQTTDTASRVVRISIVVLLLHFLAVLCKIASLGLHNRWTSDGIRYSGVLGTISLVLWLIGVWLITRNITRLTFARLCVLIVASIIAGLFIFGVTM
jgi:drug/metabolite transporter (DMT)-like permease